jgi:threonine dehydratase
MIRGGLQPENPHRDANGHTGAARIVTVTDDEVAAAIRAYWQDTHNLAEGAGAAPLAALLQERARMRGRRVGVILCGGNIDLNLFRDWVLGA